MKSFDWMKLWGIDAELGSVHVGEQVVMKRKDGSESVHEVGAVMPYLSRRGEKRVMALVFGEGE